MKKLLQLLLFLGALWSCRNNHDIKITQSDNDKVYEFSADFPASQTTKVRNYLDEKLEAGGDFKFQKAEIDANITLNNDMTFYVKSEKGKLRIEFDREENSHDNYIKIKKVCNGLKKILTQKS